MWLTMTYLFPPKNVNYYNSLDIQEGPREQLTGMVQHMTILEKALLYQGENPNSFKTGEDQRYSKAERELLEEHLGKIVDEYNLGVGRHKFFLYEGSHGLSSRVGEEIFEAAISLNARKDNCFSVLELFDTLEEWIAHGFEFERERKEFLNKASEELHLDGFHER